MQTRSLTFGMVVLALITAACNGEADDVNVGDGMAANCACDDKLSTTVPCFCQYYGCPTGADLNARMTDLCQNGQLVDVVEAFEYANCDRLLIQLRGYYRRVDYIYELSSGELVGAVHSGDTGSRCPDGTQTIGAISAGESYIPASCQRTACFPGCDVLDPDVDAGDKLSCPPLDAGTP